MSGAPDDLQRLLAEEPFVRTLAARLVAEEADDLVQQAWVRALEQEPRGVAEPRRWLARVVRNLVSDRGRRRARLKARERMSAARECVPTPVELLQVEERRRALVRAVNALPEQQRTVVLLRYYEGLPPRRIASKLGLPVTTVSNRLSRALQNLRVRLDAEHGEDRHAWLLPLVPCAARQRALPWREVASVNGSSSSLAGVIDMATKMKIVAGLVTAAVLAVAWVGWSPARAPETVSSVGGNGGGSRLAPARSSHDALAESEPPVRPSAETATPQLAADAATGTLVVHVRFPDQPQAGAGMPVTLRRRRSRLPRRTAARCDRPTRAGHVRRLGSRSRVVARTSRFQARASAQVLAGATAQVRD